MTCKRAPESNADADDLASRVADLHSHLVATAELPIDPKTNRWLGEAKAVASDAASPGLDPKNEDAVAHLDAAREARRELLPDDY